MAQMVKNQETGFDPWVGKIPWRGKRQPTPVFLPEELHGQRNLVRSVHGVGRVRDDLMNSTHTMLLPLCSLSYFHSFTIKNRMAMSLLAYTSLSMH